MARSLYLRTPLAPELREEPGGDICLEGNTASLLAGQRPRITQAPPLFSLEGCTYLPYSVYCPTGKYITYPNCAKFQQLNHVIMAKKRSRKTTSNTGIPGLSFSWREFLGITKMKRKFTKETGIPTTKAGIERKIGRAVLDWIFGNKEKDEKK